jgi:Putative prokaryotic signal transducing protein
MRERKMLRDEPLELVKVCGPTEAEMIREMLANNGIETTLQGEMSAQTIPATGDLDEVRIWAAPEDVEQAVELIDAFFTPVAKGELKEGEPSLGVDDPDEPGGFTV